MFLMKIYSASFFKTHFGAVLDRAGSEPIRIDRRGRAPTVLIPESEYRELKARALSRGGEQDAAFARLELLASGPEADVEKLRSDPRAGAILRKHS